jgi:RNA polymerase sigma-70 factor (ECF subfamily)
MFTHDELLKETTNLSKFAFKLTRNRDDADDLLQSTIATALDKQDQFEHGTNLFSWTSRIMFNAFVSAYRHNSRFETQYDPQWYIDNESVEPTQESEAELSLVLAAMMSLSEDHREILRMVCIDGMQYAEVAQELRIPVGTVRSRLSRAREGLQERLHHSRAGRHAALRASIRNEASMVAQSHLAQAVAANEERNQGLQRLARWRA